MQLIFSKIKIKTSLLATSPKSRYNSRYTGIWIPCVESWAAWEIREVMLKGDGPAVRNLWIIDCNEACVTAAVRTKNILCLKFK